MAQQWNAAGHTHDTLVHCLGNLAEGMTRQAFSDARLAQEYSSWIAGEPVVSHVEEPFGMRVFWVTFDGGQVALWARPTSDEFMLTAIHESFSYTAALGFDVDDKAMMGVHVLEFGGCAVHALAFARQIIAKLVPKPKVKKAPLQYTGALSALN